jgi:hypothetical protein
MRYMTEREYRALRYIASNSPCFMPSGAGAWTRAQLLVKQWIEVISAPDGLGRDRHAITAAGAAALEDEQRQRLV